MTGEIVNLSNVELDEKLVKSSTFESKVLKSVLLHLAEMEKRQYYRELGYPSLFEYCVKRLKYSEGSAWRRIAVARLSIDFPVLELLEKQEVTLCSLATVSSIISKENFNEMIEKIQGKKTREVQGVVALLKEPIEVRETIKVVPPKVKASKEDNNQIALEPVSSAGNKEIEEQFLIRFAADKEFMEKLGKLKMLKGDKPLLELLKGVMEEYIEKHSPEKRKERRERRKIKTEAASLKPKTTRHIPVAIKDEVYIRDGTQCSYTSVEGIRCSATHGLELDHIKPFALGGEGVESNLRLTCKSHNLLYAEKVFGKEFMEQFQR